MTQEQDKERAAFEAWQTNVLKRDLQELARGGSVTGEYDDIDVHNEWTAWQARAALAAPQPNAALADGWMPIKELGYDDDGEALLFKHAVGVVAAVWLNEDHPDAEGRGWHEAWSHKRLWDCTHMHALPAPPTLNASKEASNG